MTTIEGSLAAAVKVLQRLGARHAVVGGLAVSARTDPRFTRDVDLAVSVRSDAEAERIVAELQASGYRAIALVEQEATRRLATARLSTRTPSAAGIVVDLLFASSGIEPEVVAAATSIELFPSVHVPVARTGHLIALKLLARDDLRRPQDALDLHALLRDAPAEELQLAREAIALIEARGFQRGKNLMNELERALSEIAS